MNTVERLRSADDAALRSWTAALEELMSHDSDLIVIDPADGTGILEPDAYRDLYDLLSFLRAEPTPQSLGVETRSVPLAEIASHPHLSLVAEDYLGMHEATVWFRGARVTARIENDPEPEFADTHLRATVFADPPPRGSDRQVASFPILVKDTER